eukprot:5967462-Amphidinium_carterae.2
MAREGIARAFLERTAQQKGFPCHVCCFFRRVVVQLELRRGQCLIAALALEALGGATLGR